MTTDELKTWSEIAVNIATIVGIYLAIRTYRENQAIERSKWASALYEKFYEKSDLKGMRRTLDCSADNDDVASLVDREPPEFTDYLNFFEHVTYLVECNRLTRADALAYFSYYLACLTRHKSVLAYIEDKRNDYQSLARFLRR
jgi:hypothetical protein